MSERVTVHDQELERLREELDLARPIVALVHACYEASRRLPLHGCEESDELWEKAEEMMRLVARQRGEEWKLPTADVAKNVDWP